MKHKAKAPRAPRRDKKQERIELLEHHLKDATQRRERDEKREAEESMLRVYGMLDAERSELLARADKITVLMKSLGVRLENQCSPISMYRDGFSR